LSIKLEIASRVLAPGLGKSTAIIVRADASGAISQVHLITTEATYKAATPVDAPCTVMINPSRKGGIVFDVSVFRKL
jgi:hypothetical protein